MSNPAQTASNPNGILIITGPPGKQQLSLHPESGGLQGVFDND
jgi:hypothetical protein